MDSDLPASAFRTQRGNFLRTQIYPLQDRVLQYIRKLNLPFYLTGATALNRFILSARYTRDLEFCVNADPGFSEFAQRASQAIAAELTDAAIISEVESIDNESSLEIRFGGDLYLRVKFRNGPRFHADGARQGGLFWIPECGKLDYWLNIFAEIVAREAKHRPDDAVDLWWMAKNYPLNWSEILAMAQLKVRSLDKLRLIESIAGLTVYDLDQIPWVIDQNSSVVFSELQRLSDDIMDGRENSLAPEPVDDN